MFTLVGSSKGNLGLYSKFMILTDTRLVSGRDVKDFQMLEIAQRLLVFGKRAVHFWSKAGRAADSELGHRTHNSQDSG